MKTCIRIFWKENNKDKTKRIYPKTVLEKKWENGLDLYMFGYTEVCKFFNVFECPEHLDSSVRWCYEDITIPQGDPDKYSTWKEKCEKEYNTDDFIYYSQLFRESWACDAADSMLTDAYDYLIEACRLHKEIISKSDFEEVMEPLKTDGWKELKWIYYLFDKMIGYQTSRVDTGAWIFRDGSYITIEPVHHRRFVEDYLQLKEKDMEKEWVKISLYKAYTHKRMTDAQRKTLNKFLKEYPELSEVNIDEW